MSIERFVGYVRERSAIVARRASGALPPWTDDEVLRTKKFCCVVRDDDRTSREAHEFILSLPEGQRLAPAMYFRVFNRLETLRSVVDLRDREQVLGTLRMLPLVFHTTAYRVNLKGGLWNLETASLIVTRAQREARDWKPRSTAFRTCELLRGTLGVGSFVCYQIMQDLRWLGHRYEDEDEWCYLGGGGHTWTEKTDRRLRGSHV